MQPPAASLQSQPAVSLENAGVNLNEVIRYVIAAEQQNMQQRKLIFRCDALPIVKGDLEQWKAFFATLMHLIINAEITDMDLFIYIRSEEKASKTDIGKPINYSISVQSNIINDSSLAQQYLNLVKQYSDLAAQAGANFIHHLVAEASCIFTINLAGKSFK